MTGTRVFVARLTGSGVFDPAGDRLGRIRDVLVVYRKDNAPRVVGLLAELPGKRRVFISIGRVSALAAVRSSHLAPFRSANLSSVVAKFAYLLSS